MSADWVMVAITCVYVIATIAICYYNKKSADAANLQAEVAQLQMKEMLAQYKAVNRPIITIRFDVIRSGLMCFIVENEGPLPARNVIIKINQEFLDNIKDEKDKEWIEAMNTSDLFLASKQQLYFCLGGMPQFDNVSKVKAIFDITYNGVFEEHIEIDIRQYRSTLIYNSALEDISKHLKQVKEDNKKFYGKLEKILDKPTRFPNIDFIVNEEDSNKKEIYKTVCLNPLLTTSKIAELVKMDEEYVLEKLLELCKIDRIIDYVPDEQSRNLWVKR